MGVCCPWALVVYSERLANIVSTAADSYSTRLDLVERFASKNPNARFVMVEADNTFLLPVIVDGGQAAEKLCQRLQI